PPDLAVGEDLDARLALQRDVLGRRAVLGRAQPGPVKLAPLVPGPGLEQPGLPQQAADVLGVVIRGHGLSLSPGVNPFAETISVSMARATTLLADGWVPPASNAAASEVERLGHRGGVGRLAQPGQAEQLLGRGEQGEVVEQGPRLRARLGARADDQGRDVAAHVAGVGRAAFALDLVALLA